jgi:hypothetical protein
VVRADKVPVAPWAQGWQVYSAGPIDGMVTLIFEHEIDTNPAHQLAAVTGLLGTIQHARLDTVWWVIQTRGPLPIGEGGDGQQSGDSGNISMGDFLLGGEGDEPAV